jgi:hypothetical protein
MLARSISSASFSVIFGLVGLVGLVLGVLVAMGALLSATMGGAAGRNCSRSVPNRNDHRDERVSDDRIDPIDEPIRGTLLFIELTDKGTDDTECDSESNTKSDPITKLVAPVARASKAITIAVTRYPMNVGTRRVVKGGPSGCCHLRRPLPRIADRRHRVPDGAEREPRDGRHHDREPIQVAEEVQDQCAPFPYRATRRYREISGRGCRKAAKDSDLPVISATARELTIGFMQA